MVFYWKPKGKPCWGPRKKTYHIYLDSVLIWGNCLGKLSEMARLFFLLGVKKPVSEPPVSLGIEGLHRPLRNLEMLNPHVWMVFQGICQDPLRLGGKKCTDQSGRQSALGSDPPPLSDPHPLDGFHWLEPSLNQNSSISAMPSPSTPLPNLRAKSSSHTPKAFQGKAAPSPPQPPEAGAGPKLSFQGPPLLWSSHRSRSQS